MTKQHKIDWTLYIVDDRTRTSCFRKGNPGWKILKRREYERNKTYLVGYKRIFRNGKTKKSSEAQMKREVHDIITWL